MEFTEEFRKEFEKKLKQEWQPLPDCCEVRGNYRIDLSVWLKWLDYEPEFESELIQTLFSKDASTLSFEELQILTKYQERKRILQLIKRYQTNFDWDVWNEANTYLKTESIDELMLDKLSQEEKEHVKIEIERLKQLPYEELDKNVKELINEHEASNLSMVNSYILHEISEVHFNRSIHRLNSAISRSIESDKMLSRVPEFHPLMQ